MLSFESMLLFNTAETEMRDAKKSIIESYSKVTSFYCHNKDSLNQLAISCNCLRVAGNVTYNVKEVRPTAGVRSCLRFSC